MSKRFVAMLVAAAALAAAVVGCGGGDGGDEASLTKAQFVKQADAICVVGTERIGRKLQAFAKDPQAAGGDRKAQAAEVSEDILHPGFQAEIDEMRELAAPEGDEEYIAEMLDAFEAGLEENKGSLSGFYERGKGQLTKGLEMSKKYGMVGCLQIF